MSFQTRLKKQPTETLPIVWDFTDFLADNSDTVVSFALSVETGIGVSGAAATGGTVAGLVAGGDSEYAYQAACDILTTGGLRKRETILVKVIGSGVPDATPIDGGSVDDQTTIQPLDDGDIG